MSLAEYRQIVGRLPTPSTRQIRSFVDFVSQARSWHKFSEFLLPPGGPFVFFLDPSAGLVREIAPDGRVVLVPRLERGYGEWEIPTDEYRQRFGYLAFSNNDDTSNELGDALGEWGRLLPSDCAPVVFDWRCERVAELPAEVRAVGQAWVSGVMHPRAAREPHCWMMAMDTRQSGIDHGTNEWPAETGGPAQLGKILRRCHEMTDKRNGLRILGFHDDELYRLVDPERQRQLNEMVQAIERVLGLAGHGRRRRRGA